MSIRRRWTATCDHDGCDVVLPLIGDQDDGKWTLGTLAYESGWQASPGSDETYCPIHVTAEWSALLRDMGVTE